jgi:hypothetical protein
VQNQLMLEVNPEGTINPFGYRRITNRSEALVRLSKFAEYVIHADSTIRHYLLVNGIDISGDGQGIPRAGGLHDKTTTQEQ